MAKGSTVEVWSTVALKEAFNTLMPQFEQATGYKADVRWVPTVDLMNRLKAGEPTDLVIATRRNLDELIRAGAIAADHVVPLVRSVVAMAVRAGARKPDISSAAALKRALLEATSIAYSLGPSGVHVAALVERFGIADALKAQGHAISKSQIILERPIKTIGMFDVRVALHPEVHVIVKANVAKEAVLMTDEAGAYRSAGRYFAGHGTTTHSAGEYVNLEDRSIHSNTVEGYFSIFKRGMKGVYQHCGERHLHLSRDKKARFRLPPLRLRER